MANNTSYVNPVDIEDCVQVKQEPETDVNGQLALTEGNGIQEPEEDIDQLKCREELYAGHVVKEELVIGPEVLQQPDATFTPGIFKGSQYHAVLQADSKDAEDKKGIKLDTKMEDDNGRQWEGDKEHKVAITETENIESVEMGVKGKLSDQYLEPVQDSRIAESSDSVEDNIINYELNRNTHCSRNECKYQTVTSETVNQELILNNTIRYFVCDSCGLTLHSKQHLVRHINICQEHNYAIDIFKPKYSHENDINTHYKVHHKVKHKLSDNSLLKKRLSKHSGEKLYFCAHCEYNCSRKSNILVHLRTHSGEKPYTCAYCEYSCSHACNLKRHERRHTGDKPYTCTYCNYSCRQKGALKVHIRKHTGKKPYICTYCEYSCSNACNLKRHQRRHTGDKPYTCTYCDYSFSQRHHLKLHIRMHTGAQYHAVVQADSKGTENKKRMKLDTKMEDDNDRKCEDDKEHKVAYMGTENIQSVEMGVKGKLSDRYLDPVQDSRIAGSSDSVEDNIINDELNKNTHCSRNECKYQTVTNQTLNQELRLKGTIRNFVCDSCGLTLHSKQHLVRHINICQEDNYAIDILKPHKNDINTHHKVHRKVKLKLSDNSFLKKSLNKHSGDKLYFCAHCKYNCSRRSYLKVHLRTHTGEKPYTCTYCECNFNHRHNLKVHIRRHTGEKPYTCTYCQCSFCCSHDLKRHLKTHTGEKPYTCTYCNYSCSQKSYLKVHFRMHTGEKPYTCAYCEYGCSHACRLKRHERTHTGDKPYSCTYCDYSSSERHHLREHIRKHTGEKPYTCTYCEYSCRHKSALKVHLRTHTGEKPYTCTYCDYNCRHKSALKDHLRTHTDEKRHTCTYCDYSCSNKNALKVHLRKHTGEKPYICTYCEYSCSYKSNLKVHLRTHTDEKPYTCTYCDYSGRSKSGLKVHLRKHTVEKGKKFI